MGGAGGIPQTAKASVDLRICVGFAIYVDGGVDGFFDQNHRTSCIKTSCKSFAVEIVLIKSMSLYLPIIGGIRRQITNGFSHLNNLYFRSWNFTFRALRIEKNCKQDHHRKIWNPFFPDPWNY